MNFLAQFTLQLRRQLNIKLHDKLALMIIFIVPIILGVISGLVFLTQDPLFDYSFYSNHNYTAFSFMLIITSIFFGLLISIVEIIKERSMIEKEKLFGISTTAYYFAKLILLSFFALIQTFILYTSAAYILEIPYLVYFHNILILYIVSLNSITLGLLISSYMKSFLVAYNMISILLLPQLLLGGGFIAYETMSNKLKLYESSNAVYMPIIAKVLPASWAYEDMMVTNYMYSQQWDRNEALSDFEIQDIKTNQYMSRLKEIPFTNITLSTSFYNRFILLIESLLEILLTLFVLHRYKSRF